MKYYFFYFLTLLLLIVPLFVIGQQVTIPQNGSIENFGEKLLFFEQKDGTILSIEDITTSNSIEWKTSMQEDINLGYTKNAVWIKFSLKNESNFNDLLLDLDLAFIDTLDFYSYNSQQQKWNVLNTGWVRDFDSRGGIKNVGFVFDLDIKPQETKTYYFRINTQYSILLPLQIDRKENLQTKAKEKHLWYGGYFGVLAVMLLYNLFIFVGLRDTNYLYYAATILCTLVIFSSVSGYFFKFVHPSLPAINDWLIRVSLTLGVITTALFTIQFLEVRKVSKWFYYALIGICIVSLIALAINRLGFSKSIVNSMVSLQTLLMLSCGIYCWVKGNKFARFYVLAWVVYIIGGLFITLRNKGILPITFITTHAVEIGSALEVVLISLALADKYRTIRKEKALATKYALELQQQTTQELEGKVVERTQKIRESNEELSQINEELQQTVETVEQQKQQIEAKNEAIGDSIRYAKRIQDSTLPPKTLFNAVFEENFVLYLPKDVVSGDFYFFLERNGLIFIAAADCTGHGVPGSLVSMIGMNLIREIIIDKKLVSPAQILEELHKNVFQTLQQEYTRNQDGMDIALCVIDKQNQKLVYSGARNPLVCVRDNTLIVVKGARRSIGGSNINKTKDIDFEDTVIDLDGNTCFYIYSDGYQDQFGGEDNSKFMSKNFREILHNIHHLSFNKQRVYLKMTLYEWMDIGDNKQTDDILVMGFKA